MLTSTQKRRCACSPDFKTKTHKKEPKNKQNANLVTSRIFNMNLF